MTTDAKMRISFLALSCISLTMLSCHVVQEQREVHTLANLQALASRLQGMVESDAALSRKDFESVVNEYFDHGEDPWGHSIIFVPASKPRISTFLLISTGSDGTLDVGSPEEYFDAKQQSDDLHHKGQDIVMKGSVVLRHGAHK